MPAISRDRPLRIALLSTGRQDWGILRSVAEGLRDSEDFELQLILGGMHCSPLFGLTREAVKAEGFTPAAELAWVPEQPPLRAELQASEALRLVAETLTTLQPDALLVAGDRFETAAAALAATLVMVPVIHLHGGEETLGAMDDALRHAITKLSHLHLTSHPEHAARVRALAEDPATVHIVGAPGLDNLHRGDLPSREELERHLGISLPTPLVMVTLHPATWGGATSAEDDLSAMLAAMAAVPATYVITLPNSDPGNEAIRSALKAFAAEQPERRVAVDALGERRYWAMMGQCDALLGNSSSAIVEAPSVALPAVNIGDRQKGRLRGANVLDVPAEAERVIEALKQALTPEFRQEVRKHPSPLGDGCAAPRILEVLRAWTPPQPPRKAAIPVAP